MENNAPEAAHMDADGKVRRQPSRGMYVLPSLFTAGNMAAGYYAITQSVQGTAADTAYFDRAALAIGIAVLFDGLDGIIARLTNTTSDFGKELDSLADVITFGVAPSLLAYIWGFRMMPELAHPQLRGQILHLGVIICFIFLICGASRLARFNISINPQPRNPGRPGKKYFVGMPIPAGAGVISSVIHYQRGSPIDNPWIAFVWVCLIAFTSFLMVSNWRFWSAKEVTSGTRHPFQLVAVIAVVGALIAMYSEYMLILIAMAYLVSGVMARLAYSWSRDRRHSSEVGPR
ncbi:MAG TPA: CDP-diacylglycerol--serine O-phosphatidyltransferase [Edaphobacter sp.]|jgi:CDP-diacylglycerol---serine O-phosphatidyltransferase|nr:CDP-diacylglycerol--serine O-phosphatidyltransferase [Edaphobacter sp.]